MDLKILLLLIFAGIFILIDIVMFCKMIFLLKKSKNGTVEDLAKGISPYLTATGVVSVLMAICMILIVVLR